MEPLKKAESFIKCKIGDYRRVLMIKAREEERKREAEAKRLQEEQAQREAEHLKEMGEHEEAEEVLKEAVESKPIVAPVKQVEKVKGISGRQSWKWKLVNIRKVDPKYLTIDVKKVNGIVKAMKMDAEEIIGKGSISVYPEEVISMRGK